MPTSTAAYFDFGSRDDRCYDHEAGQQFPWPVVAAYDDIHRWMDQGLAVHAAWQIRDVWEGLLRFLATVAAADCLQADPIDEDRTSRLLAVLLKPQGLSLGDWVSVLELALKETSGEGTRIPELSALLYRRGKPTPLLRAFAGSGEAFIPWRNRRFGHGVFQQDASVYGQDALGWLERLHDAYDDCRELFTAMTLESDGPDGQLLAWGTQQPLSYYHGHQPAGSETPLHTIRLHVGNASPLELTPLLNVQQCSVCGQWAAFYLDRHERKRQRTWFLDFVLGHSQNQQQLTKFTDWADRVRTADAEAAAAGRRAGIVRRL